VRASDPAFADPRLAFLYDVLDDDRSDLDAYMAIAEEVRASSVIDIGCGTGSLAVRLAQSGRTVVGVDPAGASLDIALAKPLAERVTWLHGDATALVGRGVTADLAVMTGNVAQVSSPTGTGAARLRPCTTACTSAAGSCSRPADRRSATGNGGM